MHCAIINSLAIRTCVWKTLTARAVFPRHGTVGEGAGTCAQTGLLQVPQFARGLYRAAEEFLCLAGLTIVRAGSWRSCCGGGSMPRACPTASSTRPEVRAIAARGQSAIQSKM